MLKKYSNVKNFKRVPYLKKVRKEALEMRASMYKEIPLSKSEKKRALKAMQLNMDFGPLDVREKEKKSKKGGRSVY